MLYAIARQTLYNPSINSHNSGLTKLSWIYLQNVLQCETDYSVIRCSWYTVAQCHPPRPSLYQLQQVPTDRYIVLSMAVDVVIGQCSSLRMAIVR